MRPMNTHPACANNMAVAVLQFPSESQLYDSICIGLITTAAFMKTHPERNPICNPVVKINSSLLTT